MSFTKITVNGTWNKAGPGDDQPASGQVSFRLFQAISDDASLQLPASEIVCRLDDAGSISIDLAATTDPTTTPAGIPYLVIEKIDRAFRQYYVEIPHDAAGGTVDLAALPHVDGPMPPSWSTALDAHVASTTNVHGIPDTALLVSRTEPTHVDASDQTPVDDTITVDLSNLDPNVDSVSISLPDVGLLAVVLTPPPTDRGPLLVAIGDATNPGNQALVAIETPFGTVPIAEPALVPFSVVVAPVDMPSFGPDPFWTSTPFSSAPYGMLSASTLAATIAAVAADVGGVDATVLASVQAAFASNVSQAGYSDPGRLSNADACLRDLLALAFAPPYVPANPNDWDGDPPNLIAAVDRLAAVVGSVTPIP